MYEKIAVGNAWSSFFSIGKKSELLMGIQSIWVTERERTICRNLTNDSALCMNQVVAQRVEHLRIMSSSGNKSSAKTSQMT